jgi:hypothetical protein
MMSEEHLQRDSPSPPKEDSAIASGLNKGTKTDKRNSEPQMRHGHYFPVWRVISTRSKSMDTIDTQSNTNLKSTQDYDTNTESNKQ